MLPCPETDASRPNLSKSAPQAYSLELPQSLRQDERPLPDRDFSAESLAWLARLIPSRGSKKFGCSLLNEQSSRVWPRGFSLALSLSRRATSSPSAAST
jgi:hypothetical protein